MASRRGHIVPQQSPQQQQPYGPTSLAETTPWTTTSATENLIQPQDAENLTGEALLLGNHPQHLPNHTGEASSLHDEPTFYVLILNGWSPGPLGYLKHAIRHHFKTNRRTEPSTATAMSTPACLGSRDVVCILEPALDMPPVTAHWCFNPHFAVWATLYTLLVGWTLHLACGPFRNSLVTLVPSLGLSLLVAVLGGRLLVAHVVRRSLQVNVRLCQTLLERYPISLVLGFSWGGAVGAELAAQGLLSSSRPSTQTSSEAHQEHPTAIPNSDSGCIPCLLVAPTTALISSLCRYSGAPYHTDAALRVVNPPEPIGTNNIHVVHGTYDAGFCPHPERWQSSSSSFSGSSLTMLQDNHIFQHPTSRNHLVRILLSLLPQ